MTLLVVGLGGAAGALSRYWAIGWVQALALIREGAWERAGAYTLASVLICVLACWAGTALAGLLTRA